MTDELQKYLDDNFGFASQRLFLDRLGVQSGMAPRGDFAERDRLTPGWNRPWTAEDKKRTTGVRFASGVEKFLARDDYDTALHDRIEASYFANLKAAHERLDLLIDLLKICFPTAVSAELIRSYDNDRLEIERVVGTRNLTLTTGHQDELRPHKYTIRDLIEQIGPEPDYMLGERIIEIKPEGERRRFRLPLKQHRGKDVG